MVRQVQAGKMLPPQTGHISYDIILILGKPVMIPSSYLSLLSDKRGDGKDWV